MNNTKSFRDELKSMTDDELRNCYWQYMSRYLKFIKSDEAVLGFGEEGSFLARQVQIVQEEISSRKNKCNEVTDYD